MPVLPVHGNFSTAVLCDFDLDSGIDWHIYGTDSHFCFPETSETQFDALSGSRRMGGQPAHALEHVCIGDFHPFNGIPGKHTFQALQSSGQAEITALYPAGDNSAAGCRSSTLVSEKVLTYSAGALKILPGEKEPNTCRSLFLTCCSRRLLTSFR